MTAAFTALCAAQSGPLEFSLWIEGCQYIFVTNEDMAGSNGDGRTKIPGLVRNGLGFSEKVYLATAELEVNIREVTIEEVGGAWRGLATEVFSTRPTRATGLDATLTVAGVTATVADSSQLPDGYYHVGTETVQVTARPTGTTATVTRARWDTVAQEHPVAFGPSASTSAFYDRPVGMAYRRCVLMAHTDTELTGTGTVVWRGILSREAALSGEDALSWSLAVDSRVKALDAPLAGGTDKPLELRGIYYPASEPFSMLVARYTGATMESGVAGGEYIYVPVFGFYETTTEWCAAVYDALTTHATISTWGVTWDVREDAGDGRWGIFVTTSTKYITVNGSSRVDGRTQLRLQNAATEIRDRHDIFNVSAGTTYAVPWTDADLGVPIDQQRRVPRSNNAPDFRGLGYLEDEADRATYPNERLYVTSLQSLVAGDRVLCVPMVDSAGAPFADDAERPPQSLLIDSVDSATQSFVGFSDHARYWPWVLASGDLQPDLRAAVDMLSDSLGRGDLGDLKDAMVARGPTLANRGQAPLVTADDFGDFDETVNEQTAGRPWLNLRTYVYQKPVKAIDVLSEDAKLLGAFLCLDADARIRLRTLAIDTAAIAVGPEVDADAILADETLGSVTGDADGIYTVVELETGYSPSEDKHLGERVVYRDLEAISRVHAERPLTIKPFSRALGDEPVWDDLFSQATAIMLLFGRYPNRTFSIPVGLSCFDILCGDWITITHPPLPYDGARGEWTSGGGLASTPCQVVGREWDLSSNSGTLDLLASDATDDVAGYAPSARVTGAAGATTAWTLTCTQTHYSQGDDLSYFASGQAIKIVEWDATSPTIREGTVNGTPTATTIDVTIASWAGMGGATYYTLLPDTSDDADTAEAQLRSMYLANASERVPLASGTSAAKVFG